VYNPFVTHCVEKREVKMGRMRKQFERQKRMKSYEQRALEKALLVDDTRFFHRVEKMKNERIKAKEEIRRVIEGTEDE
jgi:Spy/CpxP family protein refolding chaperone